MANKKKKSKPNYNTKSAPQSKPAASKTKTYIIWSAVLVILALSIILPVVLIPSKTDRMGTGGCDYYAERDLAGRNIRYVEICVEDYGRMVVLLDATTAPKTVENFVTLARAGFYDGLTFHRIIEDFMIQGGDPKGDGTGGSPNKIYGEFSSNGWDNDISHKRGVISMARSGGDESNNYGNDTASCQFFICNADAPSLDGQYAAFGYVVEGMSVVDAITESALAEAEAYYGSDYLYWLYYGNGMLDPEIQPVIKYVKVLDSYGN